jgi:hypothetical protein
MMTTKKKRKKVGLSGKKLTRLRVLLFKAAHDPKNWERLRNRILSQTIIK